MIWKTRFALTLLVSAVFASSALAQDSTATSVPTEAAPAVTAEATEAAPVTTVEARPTIEHVIVTPQALPTLTDDQTESTIGALTLVHPTTWFTVQSPDGNILLTNVDVLNRAPDEPVPPEGVIAQLQFFSTSQLPEGLGEIAYPSDILLALPVGEGQPAPVISEVAVNGVVLGRGDVSTPEVESILYTRLMDSDLFLLAVIGSITPGEAAKNEEIFQTAFASMEINYDAPFPADISTRYENIPQGISPEGFPQLGSPDAPAQIIEIGSFDCPHCREFHDLALPMLIQRIEAEHVAFTYVPIFGTGSIPGGERAAMAAICAGEQGQFWQYHDGLFGWQDFGTLAFLDQRLQNGAEALGLDLDAFNACVDDGTAITALQTAVTFVQGVPSFSGTPTILLNGQAVDWTRLPSLIDATLLNASATQEVAATAEAAVTVEATAETEAAATAEATTQP